MSDYIANTFPRLAGRIPRLPLAELPTPVDHRKLLLNGTTHSIAIKRDDLTGKIYGGNKVRKLEYLLHRAAQRNARCIATFGTVASNHAVATALYARQLGYESMCFLSHQTKTPSAARALRIHLHNETQIVRYGGGRKSRVATLRQHLQQPGVFLIPPGGSNWLGAMGFVNAGMELAAQVAAGDVDEPTRLYVANGTMATAVGIALGLALSGSRTEVHAVQVTENFVSSPDTMRRLLRKTAYVMHQLDRSIPADLANRAHYRFRTGFLGEGYARTNAATDFAIATAREHLGLDLEATYTGKAMAALLDDLGALPSAESVMFWNTYNSRPLPAAMESSVPDAGLPDDFRRYID